MIMEDRNMTRREVAEYLRVSDDTVYRLLKSGGILGFKAGFQWRIKESELKKYELNMGNDQQTSTSLSD